MRQTEESKGQGLVEFAIVLPLLLLVIFGALDLARIFFSVITVTNATREGARYGIDYPNDPAGMITATQREAQNSGILLNSASIVVTCPYPSAPSADGCPYNTAVRVTATYNFHLVMRWLYSSPIPITRYTEMLVP